MPYHWITGWRHPEAAKHVYIAVPSYGDIKAGCVSAILGTSHDLSAHGISGTACFLAGDCHVDDARNVLCARFLQTDATHLMFIDADVQFSAQAVRALLQYDEAMVCGVYPFKRDELGFPYATDGDPEYDDKGLIKNTTAAPGGFMCIRRDVIEKLTEKNKAKGVWNPKTDKTVPVVEIFHRTIKEGRSRRSGDIEFCEKVRRAGYKIHIAPNLAFNHIGDKMWHGVLQDQLLRDSGEYLKRAKAGLAAEEPGLDDFYYVNKAFDNAQFAADHALLGALWFEMKALGDGAQFLETGSGASTAVLSSLGEGTSLEHSRHWMAKTHDFLEAMELPLETVHYAPIGDDAWYSGVEDYGCCDLVFIDGPVRKVGGERIRICDHMPDTLSGAKTIVVDDVDDRDGLAVVERIRDEFGFTFDFYDGPRRRFAIGRKADG